ncbi:MAG: ParB/RepB/Spo0J family partition protein [Firmicutes bacterium]|nr:ParB/RepB/Spo0J family partition protein [Bacillota bacterium]MBQ6607300.1 ParB/RepB/Spo0J family partition protein [Bacillota bacterium]
MNMEPDIGMHSGSASAEAGNSLLEQIQSIPIPKMVPFKDHPFKVLDDESMLRTMESISQFGILSPLIVRPLEDGRYQIVSGHRRAYAAALVGLTEVPAIVRQMDDDLATILMVDSNLQRENILPSERAFAYKMKAEALKHQGERTDITSSQIGTKFRTDEQIAQQTGESRNQVQRYIRLTHLIPDLLDMVDNKQISFNPAVELSFLTQKEQRYVVIAMEATQAAPSLSQAQRMKKLSQDGGCSLEAMRDILAEVKKGELERVAFKSEQLRKYFPKSYTPAQMSHVIIKLLEQWQRKRQQQQER